MNELDKKQGSGDKYYYDSPFKGVKKFWSFKIWKFSFSISLLK